MEESELILNDLFGDRRPPPGPLTESPCQTDHHETTPILASELDICESLTLGQFLAPRQSTAYLHPLLASPVLMRRGRFATFCPPCQQRRARWIDTTRRRRSPSWHGYSRPSSPASA